MVCNENDEEVEEEPEKVVDDEVVEEETKGETLFIATIFRGSVVKETEIPVKCEDPGPCLVTCKIQGVDIPECLCNPGACVAEIAENVMVNVGKLTIPADFHVIRPTEGDKGGRPQVGKITGVFHVTRPPAPRKKGVHQLQVGSKEIEPDKLLKSAERKKSEDQKANGFKGKGLRIAPPQLKKKKKKVPLNLERKKEKKKKKQEEDEPEKKMILQCSSFDKLLGKLKIFKKILHHRKSIDAHLVKDNSKWK
ncbi:hypothetical protein PIB30_078883 [Stylosanthes scabra]|uniref:Uncharacterized protein n=1 Tax=Stylosanthes scabra TaxID=79078 RepID=A0ABU6YRS3_9FABA|nr:hypothetical protein [Stylosanthes scabra]